MNRRLIALVFMLCVVMPLSIAAFATSKTYAPESSATPPIVTNSYVLKEAVPPQVYNYALNVIRHYRDNQDKESELPPYSILDDYIGRIDGGYSFTLSPEDSEADPATEDYVELGIKNYGNFFGITVTINGEVQSVL